MRTVRRFLGNFLKNDADVEILYSIANHQSHLYVIKVRTVVD